MHVNAAEDPGTADKPYQRRGPMVAALCFMLMTIEGLDNNVISYIGPLLREEYGMSVEMIGILYSVTVFASLAGATLIAPLSDRFGRKPLLIASTLVLALCSIAMPLVSTEAGLIGIRCLIGLAFGSAVPVTFSLVAEFAPAKRRSFLLMFTSCGVAVGYMLAGFMSASIIPDWGWRVLLYGLGGASIVAAFVLGAFLPESPDFLARKAGGKGGAESPDVPVVSARANIATILKPPYLPMTGLILVIVVSVYSVEFMKGYWLPTLLMEQGYSLRAAGYITAISKIGGITGALAIGLMMDRWGVRRILIYSCILAAAMLAVLPATLGSAVSATAGIMVSSLVASGSFQGSQALAVTSYPQQLRVTATGWISGLARFVGGGAGALLGGAMLGAGYDIGDVCMVMAAWMVLAFVALLGLEFWFERRGSAALVATAG